MKSSIRHRGGVVIADLTGRLTMGAGEETLRRLVDGLLADRKRAIVLNFAEVEFMDSSGLGELVRSLRIAKGFGASLKILNAAGRVYDTLSLARLLPIFEVYDGEDDVVASFASAVAEESEKEVRCEVRAGVAILTLHRPRRFNAITRTMLSELAAALTAVGGDAAVRAVVLTGSGRAFCFGADVAELGSGEGVLATLEVFQSCIRDIAFMAKPVIGAINGFATGAGLDLALACDLRVLSSKAKLSSAFLRFGLVPDGGSSHRLPLLIGPARAAEMVFTARAVGAEEALHWGLVNRVVAPHEVLPMAEAWAEDLARGPALAMGRAKRLLRNGPVTDLVSALAAEAREQSLCLGAPEFREGLMAHIEKRDPSFPK